ncbi:MAG: terpene cyclase/mutase family protein [Chitinophagales bacterium]|nr:terpene cyclase/mutase family protein [Chitinophagales bacterium]
MALEAIETICPTLTSEAGRQLWNFANLSSGEQKELLSDFSSSTLFNRTNPNSCDLIYRNLKTSDFPKSATGNKTYDALYNAIAFYQQLQAEDGHLPGDYGGPNFLLPGLIVASYVTESPLPNLHQELMKRYMLNHQNADGGWGLHIEGCSTMFGTAMQYVALRLLGMEADSPELTKARKWIHANASALGIPSWGKFYLSVLGVYEWEGCNSLFPEMWLFPEQLPFHPSRYWCHARMVYLPMAYCYGYKVTGKKTPLIEALRKELYTEPYENLNWKNAKDFCSAADRYTTSSSLLNVLNLFTNTYEKVHVTSLRKKALAFILDYINAEDEQTKYINLGPVNKVINSICIYHAYGKDSPQFKKHYERWFDYLWLAEDGLKMNGYNGSQLWDTAFTVQAVTEGKMQEHFPEFTENAYRFIDNSQVQNEVRDHKKFYRHDSVGGWPFSTVDHGWPITDCTAEGLKVMLEDKAQRLSDKRLQQSADLILSFQNKDGGWASYENTRGGKWLEMLNPSEIFGNIMIDYSYTECSSACVQALAKFQKRFPEYRQNEISKAVESGAGFISNQQRKNGSWYGSWAVCFTYGTWFGVEGLLAAGYAGFGKNASVSPQIKAACNFLVSKQNADGGWGESFESCLKKEYVPHKESQVVNTAWALLSLMAANYPDKNVIDRGIAFLLSMQLPNGDFPQQGISGVFNHSCGITYTAYRNVFPIWALSRYKKLYGV